MATTAALAVSLILSLQPVIENGIQDPVKAFTWCRFQKDKLTPEVKITAYFVTRWAHNRLL